MCHLSIIINRYCGNDKSITDNVCLCQVELAPPMSSSFPYHQGIAVVLRSSFWGLTELLPKKSHPSHWWTDYQYWLFVNSSWLYWIDHWEIKFMHMWKYIAAFFMVVALRMRITHIWYGTDQIFLSQTSVFIVFRFFTFQGKQCRGCPKCREPGMSQNYCARSGLVKHWIVLTI